MQSEPMFPKPFGILIPGTQSISTIIWKQNPIMEAHLTATLGWKRHAMSDMWALVSEDEKGKYFASLWTNIQNMTSNLNPLLELCQQGTSQDRDNTRALIRGAALGLPEVLVELLNKFSWRKDLKLVEEHFRRHFKNPIHRVLAILQESDCHPPPLEWERIGKHMNQEVTYRKPFGLNIPKTVATQDNLSRLGPGGNVLLTFLWRMTYEKRKIMSEIFEMVKVRAVTVHIPRYRLDSITRKLSTFVQDFVDMWEWVAVINITIHNEKTLKIWDIDNPIYAIDSEDILFPEYDRALIGEAMAGILEFRTKFMTFVAQRIGLTTEINDQLKPIVEGLNKVVTTMTENRAFPRVLVQEVVTLRLDPFL